MERNRQALTSEETLIVGQRLRALRGERPQKEIAEAIGVTTMAVSLYETGKRVPEDGTKRKLADFFGESVESIFFTF